MAIRRASRLLFLVLLCWLVVPPAHAEAAACARMFPEADWTPVSERSTLALYSTGIAPAVVDRFEADAVLVAQWLEADLGVTRRTELCLFGPGVALDGTDIVPFGQRVHSVAFGPEAVVVINTADIKHVKPAIAYGLAYVALWETAEAAGLEGYPQPLADAVAQWYMARATVSLEAHHTIMLRANFLQDPSGTQPPEDWAAGGSQARLHAWNPEFGESPVGDMIDFAVTERGSEVLRDPSAETWGQIEKAYEAELHEELFGDVGGSFGWPWGLAIVMALLVLAIGLSAYEWRRKRRAAARRPVSEPPIEGFFEN